MKSLLVGRVWRLFSKRPPLQNDVIFLLTDGEEYGLYGALNKEMTLTAITRPQASLRLLVYDQSMSLPESLVKTPRPADVMCEQGAGSNQTIVRKEYRF